MCFPFTLSNNLHGVTTGFSALNSTRWTTALGERLSRRNLLAAGEELVTAKSEH